MDNSKNEPTVVVVGAGPAGSSFALRLAKNGFKTILIDKAEFPRDKVCGDGIPAKVIRLMPELGLEADEFQRLGFPIFGMELYGPQQQHVGFGRKAEQNKAGSFCVPRKIFDYYLFEKAALQTMDVLTPFKVIDLSRRANRWELRLRDMKNGKERILQADLLIAADGATSLLTRKVLGLNHGAENQFWGIRQYFSGGSFRNKVHIIYDQRLLPGYAWVFPVGETRANVGMMVQRNREVDGHNRPMQTLFEQILEENAQMRRILKNAVPENRFHGALLPLGSVKGKRIADGFLAIGDAAAFINPITGGGIFYAMQSGIAAADFVAGAIRKGDWSHHYLQRYENWWRKRFLYGFKTADRLRRWMRSSKTARFLFEKMEENRFIARLFFRIYGQPLPRFFYLRPGFWLSILWTNPSPK